jgi:hypothetical protein
MYTVSGRLVTADDTKETAPQREDTTFSFTLHHYPVAKEKWSDCPVFRLAAGANQDAWVEIYMDDLKEFTDALKTYSDDHLKLPGAQFTTASGTAEFAEGVVPLTLSAYTVNNSTMLAMTIGETLGSGTDVELSPSQTEDLLSFFNDLLVSDLSVITETDQLPGTAKKVQEDGTEEQLRA